MAFWGPRESVCEVHTLLVWPPLLCPEPLRALSSRSAPGDSEASGGFPQAPRRGGRCPPEARPPPPLLGGAGCWGRSRGRGAVMQLDGASAAADRAPESRCPEGVPVRLNRGGSDPDPRAEHVRGRGAETGSPSSPAGQAFRACGRAQDSSRFADELSWVPRVAASGPMASGAVGGRGAAEPAGGSEGLAAPPEKSGAVLLPGPPPPRQVPGARAGRVAAALGAPPFVLAESVLSGPGTEISVARRRPRPGGLRTSV